ncbi:paraquat-inducible protein A [Mucilaginibacter sp. KACC 22063]|uniref:paraquat-inducible protein A n=1 Tax=Mucilaginibacter sp. KACC 22063 TaxID=3025666 RepID=UPI002365CC47|nr:paraquat-inducible protein A [Mucilaginibacter sp. KACC 22063]WDF54374.1 paraquat-inducible protein A [Mucilaginibacter sp. KACC 22063]
MTTVQTHNKTRISNLLLAVGLLILLGIEMFCGYHVDVLSKQQEQLREDYSTVNSITFGIFSVDQWRDKIVDVVDNQVTEFKMTSAQKKELQAAVEKQLQQLVTKTAAQFQKPQKSIGGKLKNLAFNAVVDVDDIRAQVPSFAHTIVMKVNSPTSTKRLKGIVTSKLDQLGRQTYDSTAEANLTLTKYMFNKYRVKDKAQFNKLINSSSFEMRELTYKYAYVMFACVVIALMLWWVLRKYVHLHTTFFVLSLCIALVLLIVGATASIIEVDARIKAMNFMLLGDKIGFDNQVLFYQNKSILEVIKVLLAQPKPDAIAVGVLLTLFVIILPVLILIATGIHVSCNEKLANNKVVRYLALESGKWNMADVMVVGIIMTYIGLNGILKSQLSGLNIHNSTLTLDTVNQSALQPGYLIFVAYVVYETILKRILKNVLNGNKAAAENG